MKLNIQKSLLLIALILGHTSVSIASVLYFEDDTIGTSSVPGALTLSGLDVQTTTVTSVADFNTQLASQSWDLVILGEQNNNIFSSISGLDTYLGNGGSILGTTWLDNSGLSALLGASGRSGTNGTNIAIDSHPIFAGLSSPLMLANPGWGIFSSSWIASSSSQCLGTLGSGCAVVEGNSGNSLLLSGLFDTYDVSDGNILLSNSINYLLNGATGPVSVSEPGTLILITLAMAGFFTRRMRS
ncbi:MAG: PEP-CTERM sorting domain-containing protein [Alteromonadaceae bacterium]|nr:PEP-CTERM sorting domain-containing protein [Alteromonadaceae bacterium]